jgi:uncharacterized membrane protein YidH (DUF202 family)
MTEEEENLLRDERDALAAKLKQAARRSRLVTRVLTFATALTGLAVLLYAYGAWQERARQLAEGEVLPEYEQYAANLLVGFKLALFLGGAAVIIVCGTLYYWGMKRAARLEAMAQRREEIGEHRGD